MTQNHEMPPAQPDEADKALDELLEETLVELVDEGAMTEEDADVVRARNYTLATE
jgi:hypothetical protein